MAKTNTPWPRLLLLLLPCLATLTFVGAGVNHIRKNAGESFLILESQSFAFGKPLPLVRLATAERLFYALLPPKFSTEKRAINASYSQKGLVIGAYQQSPYALLLFASHLNPGEVRDNIYNQAQVLMPKNHPLQTIATQMKLQ